MSDDLDERDEHLEKKIREHTEGMPLEVLIGLVSERVTHLSFDWADGTCRAEISAGVLVYSAHGPKASVAVARAMLLFDQDHRGKRERLVEKTKDGSIRRG